MRNEMALEMLAERSRVEWRDEFQRLVGDRRFVRPILVFLPPWWRDAHAGFAYFNIVAIGPGLPYAPTYVRNYVLAHELGHIDRRHTAGQAVFWLCSVGVFVASPLLSGMHTAQLVSLLILIGSGWILFGETRREFQADDAAAERYGHETLIDGLRWMQSQRTVPPGRLYARRLERALARGKVG